VEYARNSIDKILVLLLVSIMSSCYTLKESADNNDRIELNYKNLHLFNGKYKRLAINDSINITHHCPNNLFNSFLLQVPYRYWIPDSINKKDFAEIELIDKKKFKVNLIENGKLEKSKILKGRIVGNSFVFNRRTFIIPLVFFNFYIERKTRISLLQNGNLSVDTHYESLGSFLFFPWNGYGGDGYNLEFEKAK